MSLEGEALPIRSRGGGCEGEEGWEGRIKTEGNREAGGGEGLEEGLEASRGPQVCPCLRQPPLFSKRALPDHDLPDNKRTAPDYHRVLQPHWAGGVSLGNRAAGRGLKRDRLGSSNMRRANTGERRGKPHQEAQAPQWSWKPGRGWRGLHAGGCWPCPG